MPDYPFVESIECYDRLWRVTRDGNFEASRKGEHGDFDFVALDQAGAFCGNPGEPVRLLARDRDRIVMSAGNCVFAYTEDADGSNKRIAKI